MLCHDQSEALTRYQCGLSLFVSQTSFRRETGGGVSKIVCFSQASVFLAILIS